MSIKYICDRCGKEIPENERFNVKVCKKSSSIYYHPADWERKDLCQDCADRIVRMAFAKVVIINQDFEDAVTEMVAESKTVKTTLDRIREMPVEELAKQLAHGKCSLCAARFDDDCDNYECAMGISEWLEQEVSK